MSVELKRVEPEWPEIPGYRLEAVLGRGSTGTVFRGVQLAVEREVALKVLHAELVAKPRIVERLRREARTLARLRHPHLISAIDMGEVRGQWWFAMEFVDGPSLADRIRSEGPLTEREALRLFLPLCEALEALWEGGVVHRDIKPANVLLERGPRGGVVRARLADLGLAFAGDEPGLTGQGGTLGTPHYISPEQARDPSGVDIRTDIWSFGATLFHALCGRPPFTGESMAEVLSAVLHARIPDPQRLAPHLGRGMALVVRRCLVRDPEGRYQDPVELLADLELLRERRAPAVVPAQLDPLETTGRDWRRRALVGGALAAVVAAGTTVGFDRLRDAAVAPLEVSEVNGTKLLERLVGQVDNRSSRLAGAWLELEGLRASAPNDLLWLDIRAELLSRLDRVVSDALSDLTDEVQAAIGESDFDAARAVVSEERLAARMKFDTGFDALEMPSEALRRIESWKRERISQIEGALRSTVAAYRDGLANYRDQLLLPELARLRERNQWQSAFTLVGLDGDELVRRAGLDPSHLPASELENVTVETRVRLDVEHVALERAWRAEERELRQWIDDEVERRERQQRRPSNSAQVAAALRESFERELDRRGQERDELPPGAWLDFMAGIERGERELTRSEAVLTARRADQAFELRAELLAPELFAERRYEDAAELWRTFLEDEDGAQPLAETARAELEVAQRLSAVLQRAADRVRADRGRERELRVGNIRVAGRLDSGGDPLNDGFFLRPDRGQPYRLDLRGIDLGDLEALAGLDAVDEQLDPDDRLAAAWLAYVERSAAEAQRILGSGSVPAGAASERLVERLGQPRRAAADGGRLLARLDGSEGDDVAPLALIDPQAAIVLIEVLLERHLGEPEVALRSTALRRELERLRRARSTTDDALAELAAAFPGAEADLLDARRARLTLPVPEDARERFDFELGTPLDLTSGPTVVEFDLERSAPSAPGELSLSVAGYRCEWTGDDERERGRWWAGTTSEEPFSEIGGEMGDAPVAASGARTVRIEWDRTRAALRVWVDGRRVLDIVRAPSRETVEPRLTLVAGEPVRIRNLTIESPLR